MSKSKPRPSRCTTGLRISAMPGVTTCYTGTPLHFTIWTLHHHHALLGYATDWDGICRTLHEWTGVEA